MAVSTYHTYATRAASVLAAFSITAGCDNQRETEAAKAAEEQRWKGPVGSPAGEVTGSTSAGEKQ